MTQELRNIPTNIITGFLGVGKTTAILHLLNSKPENERWAVLVNEFGEVGIDGSLFEGAENNQQGVFIREVPGGCMCCTAGLPMQIALSLLLSQAKPDRLLIEPTGLGHPQEVMEVLRSEHYQTVLDIQRTITLVDARKISDTRYTEHQTFNQQLAIADVIVANKSDQYDSSDYANLLAFLSDHHDIADDNIKLVSQGQIDPKWLEGEAYKTKDSHDHHHHHSHQSSTPPAVPDVNDDGFPECGYLTIENQGEGFHSQGWIFKPDFVFDPQKLYSAFSGLDVERLKGVFITEKGIFGYNKADNVLTEMMLDETMDSRVELIAHDTSSFAAFEQELLAAIVEES